MYEGTKMTFGGGIHGPAGRMAVKMTGGAHRLSGLFLSICLVMATSLTAFAATDKIDTVKLTFSYGQTPKAGDAVGTVSARTTSKEFTVESAEYSNETSQWELGDRPEVIVMLSASEGFRFSYTTSSHFKLSGCGAEFDKAKVKDGGSALELKVSLKRVEGKVDEPGNLEWDNTYAMWEQVDGAKEYEVRLYRNKTQAASVTTRETAYDFRDKITKGGDYSFRVRGISRYDGKAGSWSDYSDSNTFTNEGASDSTSGTWIQNQTGWWYRYRNGDYLTDCWKYINHNWYYFNSDGYMLCGWQRIGGRWYYLEDSGAMLTGWRFINGRWYYLEGSGAMLTGWQLISGWWYYLEADGSMASGWKYLSGSWYFLNGSGVMLTGWQLINGVWYYLDGNGAMYASRQTPDGYYVGASGAWIQ